MNVTEKTRRLLYLPLAYHAAILLALAFTTLRQSSASVMLFLVLDLAGVLISPMFMSLMSIAHAILHDGKVYDYLKQGTLYLLVIGALRVLLYFFLARGRLSFAFACLIASIAIFYLWDAIFAISDNLMKKRRKR